MFGPGVFNQPIKKLAPGPNPKTIKGPFGQKTIPVPTTTHHHEDTHKESHNYMPESTTTHQHVEEQPSIGMNNLDEPSSNVTNTQQHSTPFQKKITAESSGLCLYYSI